MNTLEVSVQRFCWDCNYCNKLYASKYSRDLHIKRMHTPAKCPICDVVFPSFNLYRKHYNMEHSNARNNGIDQKFNGKRSKIALDESIKLEETPALSKKRKNSDTQIKGESFKNI